MKAAATATPQVGGAILDAAGFARATGVSRETMAALERYAALLLQWNEHINLIGRDTVPDLWHRHFLDSAQLYPLIPPDARVLVDLGSGAGFPGLVLAILGVPEVHLVESDGRKSAFLREAARVSGVKVTVHVRRAGDVTPFAADVVTARGLAPLAQLLGLAEPFLTPHTICLFLKGERAAEELTRARKAWKIDVQRLASVTDPAGSILRLEHVARGP